MITLDESIAHYESVGRYIAITESDPKNNNYEIAKFLRRLKTLEGKIANGELVAVTKCKDCISYYKTDKRCALLEIVTGKNDYCSLGERKEK